MTVSIIAITVYTWMNSVLLTKACSLAPCSPGKQHCIDSDWYGPGGAMCLGWHGCHTVCPAGSFHIKPIPPVTSGIPKIGFMAHNISEQSMQEFYE